MVRPISGPTRSLVAPLNSHHSRAIISVLAVDGRGRDGGGDDGVDGGAGRGGISSMSHQTHEEECLESTSRGEARLRRDHRISRRVG